MIVFPIILKKHFITGQELQVIIRMLFSRRPDKRIQLKLIKPLQPILNIEMSQKDGINIY